MKRLFKNFYIQITVLSIIAVVLSTLLIPTKEDMATNYYIDKEFHQAETLLKALKVEGVLKEKDALALAKVFLGKGENDKAIKILEGLYEKHPESIEVEKTLRKAYKHSQYSSRYLFHLEHVLQKNPDIELYNELNNLYLSLKLFDKLKANIISQQNFSGEALNESDTITLLQTTATLKQPQETIELIRKSYKSANPLSIRYLINVIQLCLDYNETALCENAVRYQLELLERSPDRQTLVLNKATDLLIVRRQFKMALKLIDQFAENTAENKLLLMNKITALVAAYPDDAAFEFMHTLYRDGKLPSRSFEYFLNLCLKLNKDRLMEETLTKVNIHEIDESTIYELLHYCAVNQRKKPAAAIRDAFTADELLVLPSLHAITRVILEEATLNEAMASVLQSPFTTSTGITASVNLCLHFRDTALAYRLLSKLFISEYTALSQFNVSLLIVKHGDSLKFERAVLSSALLAESPYFKLLLKLNRAGKTGDISEFDLTKQPLVSCRDLYYYLAELEQFKAARITAAAIYHRQPDSAGRKRLTSAFIAAGEYLDAMHLCLKEPVISGEMFYLNSLLQCLTALKEDEHHPPLKVKVINKLKAYAEMVPAMTPRERSDFIYSLIALKAYDTALSIARTAANEKAPESEEVQLYLYLCQLSGSLTGKVWFRNRKTNAPTDAEQVQWLLNMLKLKMYDELTRTALKSDGAVIIQAAAYIAVGQSKQAAELYAISRKAPVQLLAIHLQNQLALQQYKQAVQTAASLSKQALFQELSINELLRLTFSGIDVNGIKNATTSSDFQQEKRTQFLAAYNFLNDPESSKTVHKFISTAKRNELEALYYFAKEFKLPVHEKVVLSELAGRFPDQGYYVYLLNNDLRKGNRPPTRQELAKLDAVLKTQMQDVEKNESIIREIGYMLSEVKAERAVDSFFLLVRKTSEPLENDIAQLAYLNTKVDNKAVKAWYSKQALEATIQQRGRWMNYLIQMNAPEVVEQLIEKERRTYGY